jgi:cytochrome c biogenesis protein CcmG/thiol:disulfide interchange protein DsbE
MNKAYWSRCFLFIPLAGLLGLTWFLWRGLSMDPHKLPSALLNQPLPKFNNAILESPQHFLSPADVKGAVGVLHIWATWCQTCLMEHPVWMALSHQPPVLLYSVDYRDDAAQARKWLRQQGNPYVATLMDPDGQLGIDLGVTGTPETYIFDKKGIIRYKWFGPMTMTIWQTKIMPLIKHLSAEGL